MFYQAIDALYHSQQIEGKEPASKWLDQFSTECKCNAKTAVLNNN